MFFNPLLIQIYHTRAIITRGLYILYPIFHCGLYYRAAYNAERLSFHDFFFSYNIYTKTEQKTEKT